MAVSLSLAAHETPGRVALTLVACGTPVRAVAVVLAAHGTPGRGANL